MKLQPESKKELLRIACGTAICTAAMWVLFAALHLVGWVRFDYTVVLGGLVGAAVAIANFAGICFVVQKIIDEKAAYFQTSRAYKEGNIYGVNYESIGTYMGLGTLGLLGAYIWPDEYDLDEGWQIFYDFLQDFTFLELDSVDDLKKCGGLIVYQMTQN